MKGTKLLGDAGEHYALSMFSFVGKYAAKMPDNWEGYDLVVDTGDGLAKVSVKTRSETAGWRTSKWFQFDERKKCDWYVFIFKSVTGDVRSWVMPCTVCIENSNKIKEKKKFLWQREVSWPKLIRDPLIRYENNWKLDHEPKGKVEP